MSDHLHKVVQAAFPNRVINTIENQNTRPKNETALVSFDDSEPVYIKTSTDTNRRLIRETAATKYAGANCPIRTPTVVAANMDSELPYLATNPLPGEILNDPWTANGNRKQLLNRAGHILAGVHEAQFNNSGVITGGDENDLELDRDTWEGVLCATIEWRATDWFPERFADLPKRVVTAIHDAGTEFNVRTPALLHTDCSRTNIHLDPNGLLDWERSVVGDPAFDLVNTAGQLIDQPDVEEENKTDLTEALYAGYRERAGELPDGISYRRPVYWVVWHLLMPQTFDVWAPRVDVPNDEIAEEIREEFDSRLSRVYDQMG